MKWTKNEVELLKKLNYEGKNIKEISLILKRSYTSVSIKFSRLKLHKKKIWNEFEIDNLLKMLSENKSVEDISLIIGRSKESIRKKSKRLYVKLSIKLKKDKVSKYSLFDWEEIQKEYNNKLTYRDIIKKFKLTSHAVIWAQKNNKLKLRTLSEAAKIGRKNGNYKQSNKKGIARYRQLCEFKFNLSDFSSEFDFELVKKYGWYSPTNKKNNLNGVSRDHMFSIKDGFINKIDPEVIKHPANCKLIIHNDNSSKHGKSSITLEQLLERISKWNEKYSK